MNKNADYFWNTEIEGNEALKRIYHLKKQISKFKCYINSCKKKEGFKEYLHREIIYGLEKRIKKELKEIKY